MKKDSFHIYIKRKDLSNYSVNRIGSYFFQSVSLFFSASSSPSVYRFRVLWLIAFEWPEIRSKYWRLHRRYTRTVRCGFYDSRTRTRVKLMAVDQPGLNQGCVIGVRVARSSICFRSLVPSLAALETGWGHWGSRSLTPGPFHPAELARVIRNAKLSTAIRPRIVTGSV